MSSNYRFACVVVLFNPDESVKQQLIAYSECFDKVYLFDNSSKKSEWLEKIELKNVEYIFDGNNHGISGALNTTFEMACDEKFDFLATMDQDTVFEKQSILKMKEHILDCSDTDVAVFATNFRKTYIGKEGLEYSAPKFDENGKFETTFHITSGNFLNLNLVKEVFPLDDLFIAFVDFDMDYALKLKNYKVVVFGDCMITQQIGEGIKSSAIAKHGLTNMSVNRFYYLMRNNLYFAKKYSEYKDAKKFARKKRLIYVLKILLSEKNKFAKIKMMKKGYKDYKLGKLGPIE